MGRLPFFVIALSVSIVLLCAAAPPNGAAVTATPAPNSRLQTPPPQIYEIVARPVCYQIAHQIMPVVAMVLQNDTLISRSPAIFKDYILTALRPDPTNQTGYDTTDYDSPGRTMALEHMEDLVSPIAQNIIAMQTVLDSPAIASAKDQSSDGQALAVLRDQLLKTVAMQNASLDLINGFVTTQQLGDIQHAGEEYLGSINGTSTTVPTVPRATANPAFQDPDTPGLPPNPYDIEPGQIPGLIVGYNPVTMVANALEWVRGQTSARENSVADSLTKYVNRCRTGAPLVEPSESPPPQ